MPPAPHTVNPYLDARREWIERYGGYIAAATSWRRCACAALAIAAVAVGRLVWSAGKTRIVSYFVAVDRLGDALAVGRADTAVPADARIVRARLTRWIAAARAVYAYAATRRALVTEVYAMVGRNSAAYAALNEHFRAHAPFERARTETAGIDVLLVLPLAGDTWRVEWRETRRTRDGAPVTAQDWEATVTVFQVPPADEATLLRNPMGLYVTAFGWSQRLSGDPRYPPALACLLPLLAPAAAQAVPALEPAPARTGSPPPMSPLSGREAALSAKERRGVALAGRWMAGPGSAAAATSAVVVKPSDSGLTTSMTVATDRRLYVVQLVSRTKD